MRSAILAAGVTGAFCSGITVFVSAVLDQVPLILAVLLSFVSGFLGSLFARFALKG